MIIEIRHDPSPESPLTWSNLGTMLCDVKNHNIGDRQLASWVANINTRTAK